MLPRLILFLFAALALSAQELVVQATAIVTNPSFIPGATLPIPPGAKPGFVVTVRRADGGTLDADAYIVTLRFRKDERVYERKQLFLGGDKQTWGGTVVHIDGTLVSVEAGAFNWVTKEVHKPSLEGMMSPSPWREWRSWEPATTDPCREMQAKGFPIACDFSPTIDAWPDSSCTVTFKDGVLDFSTCHDAVASPADFQTCAQLERSHLLGRYCTDPTGAVWKNGVRQ